MRVVHIITRMVVGGAQENTLLCCRDLKQEFGDEVLLVTGPGKGPEGSLLETNGAGEVPAQIVPSLCRAIVPWADVVCYRALRSVIRRFRPDVVHTHSAKAGILGRAAAWSLSVPVVIHTVHGAPFHAYQNAISRTFFRWCERWAAKRCHHMISVANAMTELLTTSGVAPADRFSTIYSGMEVEPFLLSHRLRPAARRKLSLTDSDFALVAIGRLARLKGYELLLPAIARASDQLSGLHLIIVGDGPQRSRILQQAEALRLRYTWLGLIPPDEIPSVLAAADLVVHASLREGLARVLPQAIIAGRHVVSFDIDGAAEVVWPGKTGWLVPPGDIRRLSDTIVSAAHGIRERTIAPIDARDRQRLANQFDHRNTTRQIRALYQTLLEQGRRPHQGKMS